MFKHLFSSSIFLFCCHLFIVPLFSHILFSLSLFRSLTLYFSFEFFFFYYLFDFHAPLLSFLLSFFSPISPLHFLRWRLLFPSLFSRAFCSLFFSFLISPLPHYFPLNSSLPSYILYLTFTRFFFHSLVFLSYYPFSFSLRVSNSISSSFLLFLLFLFSFTIFFFFFFAPLSLPLPHLCDCWFFPSSSLFISSNVCSPKTLVTFSFSVSINHFCQPLVITHSFHLFVCLFFQSLLSSQSRSACLAFSFKIFQQYSFIWQLSFP